MVLMIFGDFGLDSIFCLNLEINMSIDRENKCASMPLISFMISSLVKVIPELLINMEFVTDGEKLLLAYNYEIADYGNLAWHDQYVSF